MNRYAFWGVGVWVLLGAGALALSMGMPVAKAGVARPDRPLPPPAASYRPYSADSLARMTVARDLFRSMRRPASLAYDPQRATVPDVPQAPKPALALVGLIAGAQPSAVIEGFPGIEGSRVVRVGDVVGALRVKRIEGDRVVIVGMDTTWVLTVREPWKP